MIAAKAAKKFEVICAFKMNGKEIFLLNCPSDIFARSKLRKSGKGG